MFRRFITLTSLTTLLCGTLSAAASEGVWLDVPFVMQEKDGCGSASIAMVMKYWLERQGLAAGSSADATVIQRALYSPDANGIYASAMERYFRENGFRTFAFRGEWNDLKQHLQNGRPLIVALKPQRGVASLHYVVVAGLDWDRGIVMLNDPAERKLIKQDRSGFEKQWSATGNWTLLALPQPAGSG